MPTDKPVLYLNIDQALLESLKAEAAQLGWSMNRYACLLLASRPPLAQVIELDRQAALARIEAPAAGKPPRRPAK